MLNGKHELRDFLNYGIGIAEDQEKACRAHTCVLVDPEINSDDQLNVIVCELIWDGKLLAEDADGLIIPTEIFSDSKKNKEKPEQT